MTKLVLTTPNAQSIMLRASFTYNHTTHLFRAPLPSPEGTTIQYINVTATRMQDAFHAMIDPHNQGSLESLLDPERWANALDGISIFLDGEEVIYSTTVNLDDTENEISFEGLDHLFQIIREEQQRRRQNEAEPLTTIQVSLHSNQNSESIWYEEPDLFVVYEVSGNRITGIVEQAEDIDYILRKLKLPCTRPEVQEG